MNRSNRLLRCIVLAALVIAQLAITPGLAMSTSPEKSNASQWRTLRATCGDGVWEYEEFCGNDAFSVTGETEMNHDCVVDLLDAGLFYRDLNLGVSLSGDFNGDGVVDLTDVGLFVEDNGNPVSPCAPNGMRPDFCRGALAISTNPDPTNITSRANMPVGFNRVYIIADDVEGAASIGFSLVTSPNIEIMNTTPVSGIGSAASCLGFVRWGVNSLLPAGPVKIGEVLINVLDSSPATIELRVEGEPCGESRIRWTGIEHDQSIDFVTLLNVGVNGAVPPPGAGTGAVPPVPDPDFGSTSSVCAGNFASLSWAPVSKADYYEIWFKGTRLETNYTLPAYHLEYVQPGQGGTYEVRACNDCGCSEAGSADLEVRDVPPTVSVLRITTSPVCVGQEVELDWDTVAGAESYLIRHEGDPSSTVWLPPFRVVADATAAGVWAVSALNGCGPSEWTENSLEVIEQPAAVTGLTADPSPIPCGTEYIRLTWNIVPGAVDYKVQLDGQNVLVTSDSFVDLAAVAGLYVVSARNLCADGDAATISVDAVGELATPTAAPTISLNPYPCEATQLQFSWSPVADANEYVLLKDGAEVYRGPATNAAVPAAAGMYSLAARNDCGQSSPGPGVLVTSDGAPMPLAMAPELDLNPWPCGTADLLILWPTAPGATVYAIKRDGETVWEGAETSAMVSAIKGFYQVAAGNDCGWSADSPGVHGERDGPLPAPLNLMATPNPYPCGVSEVTLTWNSVPDAESYRVYRGGLQLYEGAEARAVIAAEIGLVTVAAVDNCGEGIASAPLEIQATGAIPSSPVISADPPSFDCVDEEIILTWSTTGSPTEFELEFDGAVLGRTEETSRSVAPVSGAYRVRARNDCGWGTWSELLILEGIARPGLEEQAAKFLNDAPGSPVWAKQLQCVDENFGNANGEYDLGDLRGFWEWMQAQSIAEGTPEDGSAPPAAFEPAPLGDVGDDLPTANTEEDRDDRE